MKIHEYEVLIKESNLDTFGHVNNAVYLELFEEARWDLITKNGYGLKEVIERKVGPIVLEINIRFMKEIGLREKIKIMTTLLDHTGKIGTIQQKMVNEKGEDCCLITLKVGLFDVSARKLINPTPEWKKAIDCP